MGWLRPPEHHQPIPRLKQSFKATSLSHSTQSFALTLLDLETNFVFFFVQFSQFLFVFSFFCSSCNISFHLIPMFVFNVVGVVAVAVAVVDGGAGACAGGVLSPDCFRNAFLKVLILKQIIKNSYKFFL